MILPPIAGMQQLKLFPSLALYAAIIHYGSLKQSYSSNNRCKCRLAFNLPNFEPSSGCLSRLYVNAQYLSRVERQTSGHILG